jgi:S-formylglutathione hydrolase
VAAELGLMLVMPDTSPRNTEIPASPMTFEFGNAAGFYLDATQAPYSKFFNMYTHVTEELPGFIAANFPADMARQGIFGHSMGGHGALTIALKNPGAIARCRLFRPSLRRHGYAGEAPRPSHVSSATTAKPGSSTTRAS